MVAGPLVPDGGHCLAVLYPLLYPFFCADGIAHKCRGKRSLMGSAVWNGKDLPVWWPDNPGRGGGAQAEGPFW